jgi:hypothetical protein
MENNYLKDIEIDKHRLDDEWINQQPLMIKYSDLHAQALYDLSRAKEHLDVVRAQLDGKIRQAASAQNPPEKVTETVVSNRVILDSGFQAAQEKYHLADKTVNMLKGAVYAFNSRKSALENLVRLQLGNYYSEPVSPVEHSMSMMDSGMMQDINALNLSPKTEHDRQWPTHTSGEKADYEPIPVIEKEELVLGIRSNRPQPTKECGNPHPMPARPRPIKKQS